jgi:deoxyhypusine synthase
MEDTMKKTITHEIHQQYRPKQCMTFEGHPIIQGYNFEHGLDFSKFLTSLKYQGFQAAHLGEAIEIVNMMQRENATIFLTFTSNQISCGNREVITYLVKRKKVDVLVTSAGGVEEDIIKCLKPFVIGKFDVPGRFLFENGVNRTGNIFVPNDRFSYFDDFMKDVFIHLFKKQKKEGKIWSPHEICWELGRLINNEESYLYWAYKNKIPVFCPGLIDGSLGDLAVFFKQTHPDFIIDITKEAQEITKITLNAEKTGGILLGGGISKHFALNANIFREGFDYAVYINTAQEFDGSDSGARIEEAITWGKIKATAPHVKVHCDASIAFPLLVAGSFLSKKNDDRNNKV